MRQNFPGRDDEEYRDGSLVSQMNLAQTVGELRAEVNILRNSVADLNNLLRDTGSQPALMGRVARIEAHTTSVEQDLGEIKSRLANIQIEGIRGKWLVITTVISAVAAIVAAAIATFRG